MSKSSAAEDPPSLYAHFQGSS